MQKTYAKSAAPEVIALQALGFLASETDRLERFLALTGTDVATLRARAGEPDLLAGVLDHVLGDESLLHLFCEAAGLARDEPARARRGLPGAAAADTGLPG
jgi:Protein of unknown function (DUF3572)